VIIYFNLIKGSSFHHQYQLCECVSQYLKFSIYACPAFHQSIATVNVLKPNSNTLTQKYPLPIRPYNSSQSKHIIHIIILQESFCQTAAVLPISTHLCMSYSQTGIITTSYTYTSQFFPHTSQIIPFISSEIV
jgi:hypothetical protein